MAPDRHDTTPETAPHDGAVSFWRLGDHVLDFARRPLVMGIINVTPDSFHTPSRTDTTNAAAMAREMAAAGADLLDLGAESTRPGADPVEANDEQDRLLPALEAVRAACNLPLTVDTYRAETARLALAAGADGVNDITGGRHDPDMLPLVAESACGLILMHMQGTPRTMQKAPRYDDVVTEVANALSEYATSAETAGVARDRIVVDPGIGFGKTLDHNLALMTRLRDVAGGRPLLLGASRKSFITHLTGAETSQRLGGSLATVAAAYEHGAAIVRVHDVHETIQFLEVLAAIKKGR
ncbi:MAG: dihydropteroate synthase [Alphaproteobacteria bacterium]